MTEPIWLWSPGDSKIKAELRLLRWERHWMALTMQLLIYGTVTTRNGEVVNAPHP